MNAQHSQGGFAPRFVAEAMRPHLLIVDDQSERRHQLRDRLAQMNATILEASSGAEAVEQMLSQEVALLLVDLEMDGVEEWERQRRAHSQDRVNQLPILFLTEECTGECQRLRAYPPGMADCITKPMDDTTLFAKVVPFLSLHHARIEFEQLREKLDAQKDRYQYAIEANNEGLWDWNIQTNEVYFSPRWQTMLGYEPGEVEPLFSSWVQRVHPEDFGSTLETLHAHLSGKTHYYQSEYRFKSRDGAWIWILDRGRVVTFTPEGQPLRMVGTHQEITQRKQMEEKIRRSKQQYEELTERIPVGVYAFRMHTDGRNSFDHVSGRFCTLLGVDREAVLRDADTVFRVVHPDEREAFTRLSRESARTLAPFLWIGRFLVQGKVRWLHLQSTAYVETNGDSVWDGVVIDVTERKLLENALREAKREAEAANQAKSRFLATMSHEIRTPMNTILGMGETLRQSPRLSEKEKRFLDIANRAGDALMALINDVLDLSKIEAGQLQLEHSIFPLEEEARHAVAIVQETAEAKGITLLCALAPGLPVHVRGDSQRLRQILLNLLGNAIKFTERGKVTLHIEPMPGERVRFVVTDTGVGIPADRIETIFKPFVQAEDSTTRRFGGTGLGLTICQQLIEKMGGSISVQSRPDQGSTFQFTLPLPTVGGAKGDTAATMRQADPAQPHRPHPTPEPRMQLLLVDDVPDNRLVVEAFLDNTPHRVVEAQSGEEALRLFATQSFDLVLMDIMMPGMDGLETTRRIRQMETTRGLAPTPVVALTANAMKEDMEKTQAAGCNWHLSKPLRRASLLEVIARFSRPDPPTSPPLPGCAAAQPDLTADTLHSQTLAQLQSETGSGFERVLRLFLKNFPGRLDALRHAWQSGDRETVAQAAHKLKGTSATFGALRFSGHCATLEQRLAQEPSLTTLSDDMERVLAEGEDVQQALQRLLPPSPP